MKLFYLIFVIFCMTQLTTSWKHHGGFNFNVEKNTNVAAGHYNNSQVNMSNGGYGNVQANSEKTAFFGHRRR